MTTVSSRVQFNLSAKDQSAAAFASMRSNFRSLEHSVTTIKRLFVGGIVKDIFYQPIRRLIEVNKGVPAVAAALGQLSNVWKNFAIQVGQAGLNEAIVGFAKSATEATSGSDGLARGVAALLSGGISTVAILFTGVARAADMMSNVFNNARDGVYNLGRAFGDSDLSKTLAFISAEFNQFELDVQRAVEQIFRFSSAVTAMDFSSLDALKNSLANVYAVFDSESPAFSKVNLPDSGFDALGNKVKVFGAAAEAAVSPVTKLQTATSGAANAIKGGLTPALQQLEPTMSAAQQMMQSIAGVFSNAFSSAFSSLIDGTSSVKEAFASMAKSILSNLASMAANKFIGGFFSSMLGGIFGGGGGLGASFSGLYAKGGTIPAGKWGIAGDDGPEPVMGPATVLPNSFLRNSGGGRSNKTSITVNISTPDAASFRQSQSQVAALFTQAVARGQRNL